MYYSASGGDDGGNGYKVCKRYNNVVCRQKRLHRENIRKILKSTLEHEALKFVFHFFLLKHPLLSVNQ